MIRRYDLKAPIRTALRRAQVTTIFGPRQCGKTTIAREIASKGGVEYLISRIRSASDDWRSP